MSDRGMYILIHNIGNRTIPRGTLVAYPDDADVAMDPLDLRFVIKFTGIADEITPDRCGLVRLRTAEFSEE